ncbi:Lpg1974 family pore-forming outer membrane protein, partial [Pirellulales bacterium]|nr:Lpg1974 family pore-forming outer membrane protein [Pirellulales bacterium]
MNLRTFARLALGAMAMTGVIASQAAAQLQQESDDYDFDESRSLDIVDSNVEPAQFAAGGGIGGGLGLDFLDHGCDGQFYVGGEYLYVRANYSQAISYVTRNLPAAGSPSVVFNQFDFDYDDSYRLYGGYRLCECGGDIRFSYSNYSSNSSFQSGVVPTDSSQQFFSPLEVVADQPGTSLNGRASVELEVYDIEFGKTIPLGCAMCCDTCCDTCCDDTCCDDGCCGDGCGCCCCPAWDISWRGGVRYADLDSEFIYDNTIPSAPTLEQTSRAR